jgi:hypothetical protein
MIAMMIKFKTITKTLKTIVKPKQQKQILIPLEEKILMREQTMKIVKILQEMIRIELVKVW